MLHRIARGARLANSRAFVNSIQPNQSVCPDPVRGWKVQTKVERSRTGGESKGRFVQEPAPIGTLMLEKICYSFE